MQNDEIRGFLGKIDAFLAKVPGGAKGKFEIKIFGKSALLLAGLKDSLGTKDIDLLRVESLREASGQAAVAQLESEFGRERIKVNGYYLEFVDPSFAFLPPMH